MSRQIIPAEALMELRRRLDPLPPRRSQRRQIMQETAVGFGVSEQTVDRSLAYQRPSRVGPTRADRGTPRVLSQAELDRDLIAAVQRRTSNRKGRHLSTSEAIRLGEDDGLHTPGGLVQAPNSVLKRATVNRHLNKRGLDWRTGRREPPAVRFQAELSHEWWQFDISPSDLKQLKAPAWPYTNTRVTRGKVAPPLRALRHCGTIQALISRQWESAHDK